VCALIAAAAGALILVLMIALASGAARAAGGGGNPVEILVGALAVAAMALLGGGMAIVPALAAGWLPAFAAGAALHFWGVRRAWPRRRLAWAGAGAAAALICYFRIFPPGRSGGLLLEVFAFPPSALPAAFMLAGAAAGQVYRSAMAATAAFFGFEEDEDSE
jgi:hypothetical protein